MNFQFRASRDWCDVSGVYAYFTTVCEKIAVFEHTADSGCSRNHFHIYCFGTKVGEDTVRKRLKKAPLYDVSGIAQYEMSQTCGKGKNKRPVDLSGAWIYGSKGTIPDKFNLRKNISPATVVELEALSKAFWAGGEVVLNGITIKKPRDKKVKDDKYVIIEEIQNKYKSSHKCDYNCDDTQHLHLMYKIAIDTLRARRIRWHSYDLDRYVLPAFTGSSVSNEAAMISSFVQKYFRNR